MDLELFLKLLAIYNIVLLGSVWLLAPQVGLGKNPEPRALMVARALGTDLVVIGIMDWMISTLPLATMQRFIWPNILMHIVPAIVVSRYILLGVFPKKEIMGVVLHIIPLAGLVFYIVAA
jgi:hypothetical protein